METQKAEAQAVAEIVNDSTEPRTIFVRTVDGEVPAAFVVAKGVQVIDAKPHLDKYRTAPERRIGTSRLLELVSFIAIVNRFKDADSILFADSDPKKPSITGIFDYHPAGPDHRKARFGQHRAIYNFPLSEEWKAWTAKDGQPMNQGEFAAFLEDRIADVAEPNPEKMGDTARAFAQKLGLDVGFVFPARLLQLSRDFAVHANEKVRTAINLATGEAQIQYEAEHVDQQGTPLKIPGAFLLGLPVFKGGQPFEVAARLRYRVASGQISWWFNLYRIDLINDFAFKEAFDQAKRETGLPLLVGTPES
jgi:uncharacterized protein YfdQ (DUF2303 family)